MPTVDERLERLLADAAVEPTAATDVLGAVAHKRRQRHTRRVARNVIALIAGLLVVAGSLVWLTADDATEPAVAPSRRNPATAPQLGDAWLDARAVTLSPDLGYVRGPLLQSGEYVAVAAYERDGASYKVPPSRVVRIDSNGRALDEVELQGEIIWLSDGEGARWVVTHDADNVANPQFRLKRIGAGGSVVSTAFPAGVRPISPIVAGGGAVWVPVEGGVLRFDPTTGAYLETVSLPGVQIPRVMRDRSEVYAYTTEVRPGLGTSSGRIVHLAPAAVGTPSAPPVNVPVAAMVETSDGPWSITWANGRSVVAPFDPATGTVDFARGVQLPRRFQATDLQATGNTLWARGSFSDDRTGIARIVVHDDGRAVADGPVALRLPGRSELIGLDGRDVLIASEGQLYRVAIGG